MNIHDVLRPFLLRFRKRRMRLFENIFQLSSTTTILDIGGDEFNWQFIKSSSKITILNISMPKNIREGYKYRFVLGDAAYLPFLDKQFDVAFSNSVIEHLSSFDRQRLMADEIKRVGKRYFIQTPAKYFPIEPHLITPFIHWLPLKIQSRLMRNFTIWGIITRPTQQFIDGFLRERRLLSFKEMKILFPDCRIIKEKFLFMTKSYIAVKTQ